MVKGEKEKILEGWWDHRVNTPRPGGKRDGLAGRTWLAPTTHQQEKSHTSPHGWAARHEKKNWKKNDRRNEA